MPENPNPITIDDSALILIDHQPWVAFSIQSIDRTLLLGRRLPETCPRTCRPHRLAQGVEVVCAVVP